MTCCRNEPPALDSSASALRRTAQGRQHEFSSSSSRHSPQVNLPSHNVPTRTTVAPSTPVIEAGWLKRQPMTASAMHRERGAWSRTTARAAQQTLVHGTWTYAIDQEPPRRGPERRYKLGAYLAVNCMYVQHHSSSWPACASYRYTNAPAVGRLLSACWIPITC